MKVHFTTLGCPKNQVDSDKLTGRLVADGLSAAADPESADVIERKIRAFNPWPGAFMELHQRKLKIFAASIVDQNGKPGEILQKENELIVATGKGALLLNEVQLEGKRRMSIAEFLRGRSRVAPL
jgi:methionyl-tRNA formyltransferase